jgi:hypothetical protein
MRSRALYAWVVVLVALVALPAAAQPGTKDGSDYERNVVELSVTYQTWDEDRPWAKNSPRTRTASAVLVDENHLLTTAQMVDHATLMRIKTFGRSQRVVPRVERIDHSINLALLTIDEPAALKDLKPARVARKTPTSGTLRTVRWRKQQLESVASRVIRFEVERSWGSRTYHAFLHMRTDMSAGGWAEPVFDDDALVGITVSQSKQSSRAIPAEVLSAFLQRGDGPDAAFTTLGVNWQLNRDEAVSRFLGQQGEPRGILIRQVPWGSSACGVLKPLDILLELDRTPIDADGYYGHDRLGRLRFNHIMIERFLPGEQVSVLVLRGGKEHELTLTARAYPSSLDYVPSDRSGPPPYFIAGGLVLRELDVPYLRTWGNDWSKTAPVNLIRRYYYEQQGQVPQRRRAVLISSVMPAAYNVGYQTVRDEVVERINGHPIGRIEDVVEAFAEPQDGLHVIELTPESSRGFVILDSASFDAATAEILESYQVPVAARMRAGSLPELTGDCSGDF